MNKSRVWLLCLPFFLAVTTDSFAQVRRAPAQTTTGAATNRPVTEEQNSDPRTREVSVDRLKQQYWRKDESVDVVQNRLYSKKRRFSIYAFGGTVDTDPFLEVKNAGANIGYHFNEYWSLSALAWTYFVNDSSALTQLQQQTGATASTNRPDNYFGGELGYSVIYGKLSLAGKSILYYDFHLLAGAGMQSGTTGDNFAFHFGVGQQTYLSRYFAVRLDYRRMHYKEKTSRTSAERTSWNDIVTLGAAFLLPSIF